MGKNLITEIHRISELIGIKNKITLNEGVLGRLFKNVAEEELEALIRQEVRNAILSGVKRVGNDVKTLAAAEAKIVSKIGGKTLTNAQKKGVQAELIRLAKEEAKTLGKRAKGSLKGLTDKQKELYRKAADADMKRLGTKNLGQGTREKLIKKVTTGGKKVTLKSTKVPRGITEKIKQSMRETVEISLKQKWNWGRWLKWGAVGGLSALAVWWLIANWDEDEPIVPEGMPKTDEDLTDTGTENVLPKVVVTNRYRNCDNVRTYTKGCKTDKIKPIQTCLGLVPDGKFWVKTQAALEAKGFPNGFTDEDSSKICEKTKIEVPQDEFTLQVDADNVDDILNM